MHALLATKRLWLPVVGAIVCLVVAGHVPPVAVWVLVVAAFALVFDAATAAFPRGDKLSQHRQ